MLCSLDMFRMDMMDGVLLLMDRVVLLNLLILLITEFVKEDSPFCLTRAITRTTIGPCPRSAWLRGMLPEDVRG